jgi:hypothetical protein
MKLINTAALCAMLACGAFGQDRAVQNVCLRISGDQSEAITSYVRRSFGEIKDVAIVERNCVASFEIVALVTRMETGPRPTGYAFSVLFLETLPDVDVEALVQLQPPTARDVSYGYYGSMGYVDSQILRTLPTERLRGTIDDLVARFDTRVLEQTRRRRKNLRILPTPRLPRIQ